MNSIRKEVGDMQYSRWSEEARTRYEATMSQTNHSEGMKGRNTRRESRTHFTREYILESYFAHCLAQPELQESEQS